MNCDCECEYCNKIFKSKYNLKTHQQTAKYCLKIQNKSNIKTITKFMCDWCGKYFTTKRWLTNHLHSCIDYRVSTETQEYKNKIQLLEDQLENKLDEKDSIILELKEKIVILEERYEYLAKTLALRPTTTNNNNTTTNNTVNLAVFDKSPEDIKRIVEEKFSKDYLIEGQKGCAQFVCDNIVENDVDGNKRYLITDKSRGNARYKLQDGNIVTDNGMNGLTNKLHPDIRNKSKSIMNNSEDALTNEKLFIGFQEVLSLEDDNSIFVKHMVKSLV